MTDTADHEQARVFITMLHAEIVVISTRIERAETMARTAWEVGRTSSRRWYADDARVQRTILYELHRQLDCLHARFPGVRVPEAPRAPSPQLLHPRTSSEPSPTHRDRTP
ncbi:hypothetical protein ACIGGF_17235 [Rhodococcus sp. NPDC078407]|uniref:hypothetical protein n=1 Tax=Rhodococcus sp. NPDC078407 TaxID=3364509 RepID=UPI0037C79A7B